MGRGNKSSKPHHIATTQDQTDCAHTTGEVHFPSLPDSQFSGGGCYAAEHSGSENSSNTGGGSDRSEPSTEGPLITMFDRENDPYRNYAYDPNQLPRNSPKGEYDAWKVEVEAYTRNMLGVYKRCTRMIGRALWEDSFLLLGPIHLACWTAPIFMSSVTSCHNAECTFHPTERHGE